VKPFGLGPGEACCVADVGAVDVAAVDVGALDVGAIDVGAVGVGPAGRTVPGERALLTTAVVPIANANEGVAMLESGSIDAYAGDKIKLIGLAAQAREPAKLALLAEDLSFEPYGLALPRNDSALRLEVNKALTQVYMGGEIEQIFATWLGKLGRPSSLLAAMYLLYSIPD